MSAFAVAAFYDERLPVGAARVEAVVWVRASELGAGVDVSLRVWTPAGAEVAALRAIEPEPADLLPLAVVVDDRTAQFDAGRWSDGVHEFELSVALPARAAGEQMLAARVAVVVGDDVVGRALIAVTWAAARERTSAGGGERDGTSPAGGAREAASPSGADPGSAPPGDADADAPGTAAVAAAELPTGPSPQRSQPTAGDAAAAVPCPACGAPPDEGDRFCEACGRQLR